MAHIEVSHEYDTDYETKWKIVIGGENSATEVMRPKNAEQIDEFLNNPKKMLSAWFTEAGFATEEVECDPWLSFREDCQAFPFLILIAFENDGLPESEMDSHRKSAVEEIAAQLESAEPTSR